MNVLPLDFKLPKGENHIYLTSFMAHLSQQCLKHRNTCVCYILLYYHYCYCYYYSSWLSPRNSVTTHPPDYEHLSYCLGSVNWIAHPHQHNHLFNHHSTSMVHLLIECIINIYWYINYVHRAAISKVISLLFMFPLLLIWSYPLMNCSLTLISYYALSQTQISEYFFQRLLLAWPTLWLFSSPALTSSSPPRLTKFIVMWFLPLVLPLLAVSLCSTFSISMEQQPNHKFLLFKSQLKDQLLQGVFSHPSSNPSAHHWPWLPPQLNLEVTEFISMVWL